MNKLYPMKFRPLFREKIWGGKRIYQEFGFANAPKENCGEAWLLSGVEDNETLVSNGFLKGNTLNELSTIYMSDLIGEKAYEKYGDEFPLLIKILDAVQWLSVQVHPDDNLAMERYGLNGKTEMWYILEADKGAELISGLNRTIDRNSFLMAMNSGGISEILNYQPVKPNDLFYTPAGQIHAIGPGILLAEIQQSSDITYRIYDWDRKDKEGNARNLHLAESLDAIDFSVSEDSTVKYDRDQNKTNLMVDTEHFITNYIWLTEGLTKDYTELDSFVILFATDGEGWLEWEDGKIELKTGEVVLLPAVLGSVTMFTKMALQLLEIHL